MQAHAKLANCLDPSTECLSSEDRAALEKITAKQAEVLRLALVRKSSKEIARELGIAARSVDQRLDAARVTLRTTTRWQAARRYYDLVCASEGVTSDPFMLGGSGNERRSGQGEQPHYVFGEALHFTADPAWELGAQPKPEAWRRFVPGLPSAASGSADRIVWILLGAVSILTLVLLGLGVVDGLERLIVAD